ncbi:hypothetical protein [Psychrobacter sp. AOP31-A1-22]|uniref:hypothetical protein n=1 Tax=Psychrobacter sp. AOP31-A1-22 TaxID=3457696 RepID=UPI0040357DBF
MLEILKAFFVRVPNIGALRLAYLVCAIVPILLMQDESAYIAHHETIRSALNEDVSWYKFQEADGKSEPWCILSVTDIKPQTAVLIAVKTGMISKTGGMVGKGTTQMSMNDRVGCDGVDDRNIFWLSFAKTHAAMRQDYTIFSISIWLTRLFYWYVMVLAIGNVINRRYAANDAGLMREQTVNYLKYKKITAKRLKASKKKAKSVKTKSKKYK